MNEIIKEFFKKHLWTIIIIVVVFIVFNSGVFFFGRSVGERKSYLAVKSGLESIREINQRQEESYKRIEESVNTITERFDGFSAILTDFSTELSEYRENAEKRINSIAERIAISEARVNLIETGQEGDIQLIRESKERLKRLQEVIDSEKN